MTDLKAPFAPNWISPPGDTIADVLEERGWTQAEFARRLGYTEKHVIHLINGEAPITEDTASRLVRVLGGTPGFWLRKEAIYRKRLRRQQLAQQSAAHPAITHCDNCGCDWLDNGLNPIGCPYCEQFAQVAEIKALRAERYGKSPWHITDGHHHAVGATPNEALNGFASYLTAQAPKDDALTIADYEEVLADHRRLVHELDVLLNGDGAAQQSSLCDIVSQLRRERIKAQAPTANAEPKYCGYPNCWSTGGRCTGPCAAGPFAVAPASAANEDAFYATLYRWLRANYSTVYQWGSLVWYPYDGKTPERLDAAIVAAIKHTAGNGE